MNKYLFYNKYILDMKYRNEDFIQTNIKSPIGAGLFNIFLSKDNQFIYKKIKKKFTNNVEFEIYKKILTHLDKLPTINKYILNATDIEVENDGSYYSKYILNGIRLYDIEKGTMNRYILINIKNKVKELWEDLKNYCKNNKLSGDWALHNLIYCLDKKQIYNVDLEGFYTYPRIHNNGNCDINFCNKRFNNLIKIIDTKISKNGKDLDELEKVMNVIKYVKSSGKAYSAKHIDIGYHSIMLSNKYYKGQRDCIKRLKYVENEIDVSNKNVLDIGCCIGGMLFPLANKIKSGVGIDFNYKNINAGNRIVKYENISNLSFYNFDLDKENLIHIKNFYSDKMDVVFLFSICLWIKKWKNLINFIYNNSSILFIETNGPPKHQLEQINYCKKKYKFIKNLYQKSDDDPGQKNRKLFICKKY